MNLNIVIKWLGSSMSLRLKYWLVFCLGCYVFASGLDAGLLAPWTGCATSAVVAQDDDDDNTGDDDDNTGDDDDNTGDDDDDNTGLFGGVKIDAAGTIERLHRNGNDGQTTQARIEAAKARLQQNMLKASKLRKVSLNRLEAALRQQLANGGRPTAEMLHLAGLTRIEYVFVYPETGDLVIAGPAEGFFTDASGHTVGMTSGRATLNLEDLVVALRAFGPSGKKTNLISVSIDPTQEGLQQMQQVLRNVTGQQALQQTDQLMVALREALGPQTVTLKGVSTRSRVAQILVEADYRMKLIGIGLENPPVRITRYIDVVDPAVVARNALMRWYFVPNYECVRESADGLAMQLVGDGVVLSCEDEVVRADGTRNQTAKADRASKVFAASFTKNYAELAKREPIFAELRNLMDLFVAAAYMQAHDYYGQTKLSFDVFGDEDKFAIEKYPAPEKVETAVNAVFKKSRLMTPIGGGISIQPLQALDADNLLPDEDGKVKETRSNVNISGVAEGQWWWD